MKDKENKKGAASGLYICQKIITILLIVGAFSRHLIQLELLR